MSHDPHRPSASSGLLDPPGRERYGRAGIEGRGNGGVARGPGRGRPPGRQPVVLRGHLRRWPRRVLIGVNVVVATMLIGAGTVYGYTNWRFGQIRRILLPHISGGSGAGGPINILVVGSDSRSGLTGADAAQFGTAQAVTGSRSDTIMLVHVDPASTKATLLSIPRDLWVQIPGKNFQQRINTTFDTGPDLLAQAIEQDLGIPVDHYVEVNFRSFRQVVNAVGGINEYFPTAARDAFSALSIPKPGCYTLNGDKALAFVRSRHYEYQVNGRWVSEASSDLARIKRQQSFIKKVITKAQGSGLTNPIALNNIVGGVTNNLTLDKGFSKNLLLSLAKRFRSLSPDSLPTATLPTTNARVQGNDVLLLDQPKAQQAINDFLGKGQAATSTPAGPSTVQPTDVRVTVLNGSGRGGEAAQAATGLQHLGFSVVSSHSANNFNYTSSIIRYLPGSEAKAQLLARAVQGPTQLQSDSSVQGADVELVTGQSYRGISTTPVSGGSATSPPTNAAAATTVPATPPAAVFELPGAPAGFVPPAC